MTLLDICMITIILNFILQIKVNIEVYKAFADKGYIFDKNQLKEIERNDLDGATLVQQVLYECTPFIPFYNLLVTGVTYMEYCMYTDEYIDGFKEFGIIERMNDREEALYNKKKSGIYVMLLRKKLNIKRKNKYVVLYENGDSIWYDYDKKKLKQENLLDSIVIVEARGSLEDTSIEELRDMVLASHFTVAEAILNTYDAPEEFLNDKEKDKKIDLALEIQKSNTSIKEDDLSLVSYEEPDKNKTKRRKR